MPRFIVLALLLIVGSAPAASEWCRALCVPAAGASAPTSADAHCRAHVSSNGTSAMQGGTAGHCEDPHTETRLESLARVSDPSNDPLPILVPLVPHLTVARPSAAVGGVHPWASAPPPAPRSTRPSALRC